MSESIQLRIETPSFPKDLSSELFLRGLIAALRQSGLRYIDTRDDAHHRSFHPVAENLRSLDREDLPLYIPSPFAGRYREWQDALIRNPGLVNPVGPYFLQARIERSPESAESILALLEEYRELLIASAALYRGLDKDAEEAC